MNEPLCELTLDQLLEPGDFARLGGALGTLLGQTVAFVDARQNTLWGQAEPGALAQPLIVELEPVGYLLAASDPTPLAAAAVLVNALLVTRWGYLSASSLHDIVVDADYEALHRSEARYKALSAELEQRVEAQLATLEARQRQLYESERFAAIGQLAAGVAHEINTPLGFIRSNLNTLAHYLETLKALKQQPDLAAFWHEQNLDFVLQDSQDILTESIAGAERVKRIVQDLRGFSAVDAKQMEWVDPAECLNRAIAMIGMQKPAAIELDLALAPLPAISCQAGLLSQAFLNVLNNAVQALEGGGVIRIMTTADAAGSLIKIQDNGPGIAPEILPRVFEPFFTTRTVGSGIGLGLTVARDAIEAHGGTIGIESPPGQGTIVSIRFAS